jgi:hypothetical protein
MSWFSWVGRKPLPKGDASDGRHASDRYNESDDAILDPSLLPPTPTAAIPIPTTTTHSSATLIGTLLHQLHTMIDLTTRSGLKKFEKLEEAITLAEQVNFDNLHALADAIVGSNWRGMDDRLLLVRLFACFTRLCLGELLWRR